MKIFAIMGKAGSGKDTVADIFNDYNFQKVAFADPLKRYVMDVFDLSYNQLWGPSQLRQEELIQYIGKEGPLTPRKILQHIGTEGFRELYEDVWVDYTIRQINKLKNNKDLRYRCDIGVYSCLGQEFGSLKRPEGIVISDMRFVNEFKKIKSVGGKIIKIKRENSGLENEQAKHKSEMDQEFIPDSDFDVIINNNGSLNDLKNKVYEII
jgi:hypothetical protein